MRYLEYWGKVNDGQFTYYAMSCLQNKVIGLKCIYNKKIIF